MTQTHVVLAYIEVYNINTACGWSPVVGVELLQEVSAIGGSRSEVREWNKKVSYMRE